MHKPFEFVEGWRTFSCRVEPLASSPTGAMWWFQSTGDSHHYAPFPAAKGDTQANVRERIIAWYTHRLERRAEPPQPQNRGRPPAKKKVADE